jgi:hypothetical protein
VIGGPRDASDVAFRQINDRFGHRIGVRTDAA